MFSNSQILFAVTAATILCNIGIVYANRKKLLSISGGGSKEEKEFKSQPWPTTGNKNILVCGGAGYIGTHTIVTLLASGYDVTVVDNLINANVEALRRVQSITQCDPSRIRFYECDLCDAERFRFSFPPLLNFHIKDVVSYKIFPFTS